MLNSAKKTSSVDVEKLGRTKNNENLFVLQRRRICNDHGIKERTKISAAVLCLNQSWAFRSTVILTDFNRKCLLLLFASGILKELKQ